MFGNLFKKKEEKIELYPPLEGQFVFIKDVEDPVFSQEMLGKGIAIEPTNNLLVAPADAKVEQVFDSKHALLLNIKGIEILIHIGLNTVKMQGSGFEAFVKNGEEVKKGQKLIQFSPDLIKEQGHPLTTVMVMCHSDKFSNVEILPQSDALDVSKPIMIVKE